MSETTPIKQISFACPKDKHSLRSVDNTLYCCVCGRTYPIIGGIPDFLQQANLASATSRIAKVMDFVAPIYESRLFVSFLMKLSGIAGGSRFIDRTACFHAETLKGITGSLLDVACGTATYSRRIATALMSQWACYGRV